VIFLADVSGSMRADDVKPSRLTPTQAAMQTFLGRLPKQVAVGLVSFSTSAEVVLSPTTDRGAARSAIEGLYPEAGTALGAGVDTAVKLAVNSLRTHGIRARPGHPLPAVVLLESDGAQNRGPLTPAQAASRAKAAGIRVDGVSLGTPDGAVAIGYGPSANSVPVPPDPATVAAIASKDRRKVIHRHYSNPARRRLREARAKPPLSWRAAPSGGRTLAQPSFP
jgi:Ca-activated chloride channel family protein